MANRHDTRRAGAILSTRVRIGLGALGLLLLGNAVAVTWLRPDGVIVGAFVAAGAIMLLTAIIPRLPSKVTIASSTVQWTAEEIVEAAFQEGINDEEGRGSVTREDYVPPTADELLEQAHATASAAERPEQLIWSIALARQAAHERAEEWRRSP